MMRKVFPLHNENIRQPDPKKDFLYISVNMRKADRLELQAEGTGLTPEVALYMSYCDSDEVYTAVDVRNPKAPVAMFGVGTRYANVLGYASVWFLGTSALYDKENARVFLRLGRSWVDYFTDKYGTIGNEVHTLNTASVRWLQWCGFRIRDAFTNQLTGATFYTMIKERYLKKKGG